MLDDKEFREYVAKLIAENEHNLELNSECVRMWRSDKISIQVVLIGCRYVKSLGFNTVVFNTVVPLKKELSEKEGINILDANDLILFCLKDEELLKYEKLIRYSY